MKLRNFATTAIAAAFGMTVAISSAVASEADIVDTAVSAGSFNTLAAALEAAGLVGTLKGDGPFTVFAPTDEAFAALPDGTVEMLLKPENRDQLVAVLTYHVVPAKVMSGDLAGQTVTARTVNGEKLLIDGRKGVKVNSAKVEAADIAANNGVIHVVDSVILPNG